MKLPKTTVHPATLSFDQLRAGIQDRYQRILAIDVEYQTTIEVALAESKDTQYIPKSIHHFAFKGERRFRSLLLPPPDGTEGPLDPGSILTFDGAISRAYYISRKTGSIKSGPDRFSFADNYAHDLAIPNQESHPCLPSPTDYFLPFLLNRTELDWTVGTSLVRVDGAMCHVIRTNSRQCFWIDPEIGYAMRFHEAHQPIHNRPSAQWPLSVRKAFRHYRPSRDGIWLPQRIERTNYVSTRSAEHLWNQESLRVRHVVTKLAVNEDVDEGLFTLPFPVGTTVNDRVRNRFYRVGRGNTEINLAGPEWYLNLTRRVKKT